MTQRPRAGRFKKRRQTAASTTTDRGQGTAPTQQFQVDPDLKTARAIAYETLRAVEERPVFIKTVLDELCRSYDVAGRERALAYEIAAGVTRRRTTLDAVIDARLRNPTERIESRLRTVLRIGAYQLLLLATAPHAAVFETVELARRLQPRWTRIVNGVLRAVHRDLAEANIEAPHADALPVCTLSGTAPKRADGSTGHSDSAASVQYRRLRSSPFPSPDEDFAAYVAAAFGLPDWLAARWRARDGDQELLRLGSWFATPGRTALRVNPLRATTADLLLQLQDAGVAAIAGTHEGAIRLLDQTRVDQLPGFAEGLFSVQDESAQGAAELLDPQPGQQILDLCAAPGGKSAALAERMQNQGRIVAADADPARAALIATGAQRLGLTIVEPLVVDADSRDVPAGPFDSILLDVPCSNTGVLGKRPEARWRISQSGIAELAQLQARLLRVALDRLADGGRLVYSTCSIEPEENEDVVSGVLEQRENLHLIRELKHRPGRPGDGGYQALIRHRHA